QRDVGCSPILVEPFGRPHPRWLLRRVADIANASLDGQSSNSFPTSMDSSNRAHADDRQTCHVGLVCASSVGRCLARLDFRPARVGRCSALLVPECSAKKGSRRTSPSGLCRLLFGIASILAAPDPSVFRSPASDIVLVLPAGAPIASERPALVGR